MSLADSVTTTSPVATPTSTPAVPLAVEPPAPAPVVTALPVVATPPITISMEQLQAFTNVQARLAQMEADQRSRDETAQRQIQDALLAKGQAEEAVRLVRDQQETILNKERTEKAELERQAQGFALDVHVARAMANYSFVNDKARRSFEAEIRAELIAEPQGNSFNVRTATFQSAEDLVKAKLAHADYQFYLAPKGVGGTATPGQTTQTPAAPAAQTVPAAQERPKNMGEAYIFQYQANQANRGAPTDARRDPSRQFGLSAVSN